MKKIMLFASALAGLFLAASCQQENLEPVAQGNTVTFTIEAPAALQTKAIGNGLNVNELVYEVWLTNTLGNLESNAQKLYRNTAPMEVENGVNKATVELNLVNDQKFTVLFWAHYTEEDVEPAYDTEKLTEVKYNRATYNANDESLAAFYAVAYVDDCQHVKKDGSSAGPQVVLKRPFAQLNLATLNTSTFYDVKLVSSQVTVTNANTQFNVATSEASMPVEMTFYDAAVPAEKLNNYDNYEWAGMNYIFAGDNATVEYDIVTKLNDGMTGTVNNVISSVPLKENFRTNIIGNLLTSKVDYDIIVDADFYTPDEVVEVVSVSTVKELAEAIAGATDGENTNIKLEGDIDLSQIAGLLSTKASDNLTLTIPAGKEVTLDLNGYSLTAFDSTEKNYSVIDNRGTLTVTNSNKSKTSKISVEAGVNSGWNRYSAVLANNPGGKLTVCAGVELEHLGGTDMAYGIDNLTNGKGTYAVTVIDGATVKSPYRAVRQFLNGTEATNELYVKAGSVLEGANKSIFFHDPSTGANTGKLVVDPEAQLKGDVYLFVTAESTEWPVDVTIAKAALVGESEIISANVPEGYSVIEKDGVYTVSHDYAVVSNGIQILNANGLKTFAQMVNGGNTFQGKTVALAADIDLNGEEWTPIGNSTYSFNGTFDGADHTISNLVVNGGSSSNMGLFGVTQNGEIKNLTVNNAKVSGRLNVAVVSGTPYTSKYTNITVTGHVEVNGMAYVGAVGGKNAYADWTDVTVDVDETSYVNANSVENGTAYRTYVGGVVGFNGEGGHSFKNITSNIDVKGSTIDVGGMFGIAHYGNKFENCVCTGNVEIYNASEAADAEEIGGIAGVWHNETGYTVSFTNCSFTGTLKTNITEGVDLSNNKIAGAAYSEGGFGCLVIDGCIWVSTADELVAALATGEDVMFANDIKIAPASMSNAYGATGLNVLKGQTIDGNGYTLNIKGAGGTWDSGINTTGGVIKNLTVTGSFRGIFINHTSDYSEKVVLENVTIGGNGTVYTISCDQGLYQGIEATNCTFNGWTSFAKTAGEAKFVNCSFGEGSGYKYCRPYSNTEFVNCTFCPGYSVDTTRATVTFTDCTWEE